MNASPSLLLSEMTADGNRFLTAGPIPEGCGGMLYDSFRALLLVLLGVGFTVTLWKASRHALLAKPSGILPGQGFLPADSRRDCPLLRQAATHRRSV
jgi:hypothetical protein